MAGPISNTFEGGTNNVTISAANSGGASGTAVASIVASGGSTVQFSSAFAKRGTLSMRCTYANTQAGYAVWNFSPTATTTRIAIRFYIYVPTGESISTQDLMIVRNAANTSSVCTVGLNSTGRLILKNNAGTTRVTANQPIPFDTWIRVEFSVKVGTTTSNGALEISYYLGDSTTPEQASPLFSGAAENLGTAAIGTLRLGSAALVGSVRSIYYDDFAAAELASGFLGPTSVTLDGAVATVATIAGAASRSTELTGSIAETAGVSGAASRATGLTGAVAETVTIAGAATRGTALTGGVPTLVGIDAAVRLGIALTGDVGTVVGIASETQRETALSGAVQTQALAEADVSRETALDGSVQIDVDTSADLGRDTSMTGAVETTAEVAGVAQRTTDLAGDIPTELVLEPDFITFSAGEIGGVVTTVATVEADMQLALVLDGDLETEDHVGGDMEIQEAPESFDLTGAVSMLIVIAGALSLPTPRNFRARIRSNGMRGRIMPGARSVAIAGGYRATMSLADRATVVDTQPRGRIHEQ